MSTEIRPPAEEHERELAIKRLENKRGFWASLFAFFVVNGMLVAIWYQGDGGYFWPGWVMLAWGVGLVFHAWSAFVQKPITEADIEREMHRGGGAVA
jgi:hypothetical protein